MPDSGFDLSVLDQPNSSDEPSSSGFDLSVIGAPKQSSSAFRAAADVPLQVLKGLVDLPPTLLGIPHAMTGGASRKTVEDVVTALGMGADAVGLPDWARPSQWSKQLYDLYTPEQKEESSAASESGRLARETAKEEGAGEFGQIGAGLLGQAKGVLEHPRAIVPLLAENIAPMGAIVKATKFFITPLAKHLDEAVKAGTITAAEADAQLGKAAVRAAAIGEGALTTGQVEQDINTNNPDATLIERMTAIAAGAVTGKIAHSVGNIRGLGDVEASMAVRSLGKSSAGISGNVIERIGKGLLSEGLLQEFPQSAQERIWTNLAEGKPWQDGVGEDAIMGLVAGGLLGGGAAGISRSRASGYPEPDKPISDARTPPTPAEEAQVEPAAEPVITQPTKPGITPITDIVRERDDAMADVQDISRRIDMLAGKGLVVPNFLNEDLADAKARFANAKNVGASNRPVEEAPQPLDTMKADSIEEAVVISAASVDAPVKADLRTDVLVSADTLDKFILGKDYENGPQSDDQAALDENIKESGRAQDNFFFAPNRPITVVHPLSLPITSDDPMQMTQGKYEAMNPIYRAEGKRLIIYDDEKTKADADGFVMLQKYPGVVFISSRTTVDPITTGFHEIAHTMEGTPLYDAYVQTVKENLKNDHRFTAETRGHSGMLSDEELTREISADIHGDAMRSKDFWAKVSEKMDKQLGASKAHAQILRFLGQLREMIMRAQDAITGATFQTMDGRRAATQYVRNFEKVHEALAAAVADKYVRLGYANVNAPLEAIKIQQFAQSKKQFNPKIPSPEVVTAFQGLAKGQRGKPESAMLKVQDVMGGSALNPVVESVGDLTHRMTEMTHYGMAGQPYVSENVDRSIRLLGSRYGFQREFNENLKNNATYNKKDPTEYRQRVYEALKEYANEHRALPVYNELQFMSREAAVAVGERRWEDVLALLKKIKTFADMDPEAFHEKAFEAKLGGGKVLPYVDVESAGARPLAHAERIQATQESRKQASEARAESVRQAETAKLQSEREKVATEQPMLTIGKDKVITSQTVMNKFVAMLRTYTTTRGKGTNAELSKELHNTIVKNILWLHDLVPEPLRERAKLWYDGAHKMNEELANKYGLAPNQADAVMAVLSPQKDWFMNVSLAERAMSIIRYRSFEPWSPAMTRWVESYQSAKPDEGRNVLLKAAHRLEGKILADISVEDAARFVRVFDETYHERAYRLVTPEGGFLDYSRSGINGEEDLFGSVVGEQNSVAWGSFGMIEKAVSVMRNGSDANIAAQLGKASKVQNFYQNMRQPNSTEEFVTVDTHAIAAALLKALSGNSDEVIDNFGRVGMYNVFADAYRDAAAQRGVLPREMQSISWEAVRALFPWSMKKALAPKIEAVWKSYREKEISQQVARERIYMLSGGMRKFMWQDGGQGLSPMQGGQSFDTTLADNPAQRKERVIHAYTTASTEGDAASRGAGGAQVGLAFSRRAYSESGSAGITLTGLPTTVKVDGVDTQFGGFAPAQQAAKDYMRKAGLRYEPETQYHALDTVRATRIAEAYERMEHRPNDPDVQASYRALIDESAEQYRAMLNTGLKVEFIKGEDPYGNPRNAILDVVENNHLWVYSTADGFGSDQKYDQKVHPLLESTKFKIGGRTALANDIFRAVHDYFGNIKEGIGFLAEGEDNAWYSHVAMFTPLAQKAMTSETRGQNSWVNYGPYGEANRNASPKDTHYADQKAGFLPDFASARDRVQAPAKMIQLEHYSKVKGLTEIDPKKHGTGQTGAELQRKANAEKGTFVDRSYYYREGSKPEARFRHEHKYQVEIDESKLANIAGSEGDVTLTENKAEDQGYIGFYNSEGADPNAVALFGKQKVKGAQFSGKTTQAREVIEGAFSTYTEKIAERYANQVRRIHRDMVASLGPALNGVYNSHRWVRQFNANLRGILHNAPGSVDGRIGNEQVINEERLADRAKKYSEIAVKEAADKLIAKLGPIEDVQASNLDFAGSGVEFELTGTIEGHRVRIAQQMIMNVSGKGTVFNQWPARIYVDGDAISEKEYKDRYASSGEQNADDAQLSAKQDVLGDEPVEEKQTATRYEVYDPKTGQIIGDYESRKRASNKIHKLDMEYGAVRYAQREVEKPIESDVQLSPAIASTFPLPAQYTVDQPTRLDKLIRIFQDKNIDIARLVQAVKAAGGDIPVEANPVLREEMYHKRTEQATDDFINEELQPLIELMREHGITIEMLNEYLHARHVIDDNLNLKLAALNPNMKPNDALSGMTDAEANTILTATSMQGMAPVAKLVDDITAKTRRLMIEYGLESRARIDSWENAYKSYVPLRREGMDEEGYPTGTGRSVRGSSVKMRMGSEKEVGDILANIAQTREQTIVRGEKEKPVIAMAALLMLHPNADIGTLVKPAPIEVTNPLTGLVEIVPGDITTKAGVQYKVPLIRAYDPKSGTVKSFPDPAYKGRDNVVNFRMSGVDYAIVFNEEKERAKEIANAFKSLGTPELNGFLAAVAPYTRYLASINTQYNPIFGIINFVRDVQFASLALSSTPLAGKQKDMLKATITSLGGIYADSRAVRMGKQLTSPTAQLWRRFERVGGPTGYRDIFKTTGDRADAIERMLNPKTWSQIRTPGQLGHKIADTALFEWLSDYNQTMENAVRLGVFKVAIDMGYSDIEAASFAKNITVNFNKKGQIGAQMGAMYAFFNANVQGTARIMETVFDKDGNLSPVGKKIIIGGVLIGVLQAIGLALAGYDEDDVPEFVKQRAVVIPAPFTDKGYVTIPMPLGFNILPNMGRLAAETVIGYAKNGNGRPLEHAYQFLAASVNSFIPTGGSASLVQELAPTVADPFLALEENIDWTGKPIFREDMDRSRPTPGFTRARDTATIWAKVAAKGMNFLTGGNEYRAGLVSPTPDAIDYLLGAATGGVGREVSKFQQVAHAVATGEDVPVYKIPLVGRFAGTASGKGAIRERFYENLKAVNTATAELKGRIRANDSPDQFRNDHPEVALSGLANTLQDHVSDLQKYKRELLAKGASRDAVRLQEERITAAMSRLTTEFSRLTK